MNGAAEGSLAMKLKRKRFVACLITASVGVVLAFLLWPWSPELYRATILPSLGGRYSAVHAVNDRGQVVGVTELADGSRRLFLWDRDNGTEDLGPVTGDQLAINNAGHIAGTMSDRNGHQAFFWELGKGRTMLGTLGGDMSLALAINNRSQIVGVSSNAADAPRLFLWDKATGIKELDRPEARGCWPEGIDDRGRVLVAGVSKGATRRYLLRPEGPVLLKEVPPDASRVSLNSDGSMAATVEVGHADPYLALWRRGEPMKRLASISAHTQMTKLNERNQVAWTSFRPRRWEKWRERLRGPRLMREESVSYLWDPARGKIPLDRYVGDVERFYVVGLNNHGSIIGNLCTKDGQQHAALLEPIPERWGDKGPASD